MNCLAKGMVIVAACSAAVLQAHGAEENLDTEDLTMTYGAVHLTAAAKFREEAMKNSFLFDGNAKLAAERMKGGGWVPDGTDGEHAPPDGDYTEDQVEDFFGRVLRNSFFEPAATNKWQADTSVFSTEQIADFFVAAEVFLGPFNDEGAVVAYYNPWWDAILLTRTEVKDGLPKPNSEDPAHAPKIAEFVWLAGETFRGEALPQDLAKTSILTVVPEEDPISVEIWRRQCATLARFNAIYGATPLASTVELRLRKLGIEPLNRRTELDRIQVRAGLRLKLLSLQMKSEEAVGVAKRVTDLLHSSSVVMLKRHFTSPVHEFFCETFAQMNKRAFRKGFVPYGYVPTAEGALYIFVNAQLPRLYATVSMPAGLVDGETEKPAIFEWYDLEQAEAHLVAWEEDKAEKAASGNAAK